MLALNMQKHYWMLYLQTLLKALQFIYTGRMGAGVAKQYYSINRLRKPWPTFALEVFCLSTPQHVQFLSAWNLN